MIACPTCSKPSPGTAPFCAHCGAGIDIASLPTVPAPGAPRDGGSRRKTASPASRTTGSLSSTDSFVDARFLPGDVLAGRYRIIGPIGRGGMGEVYRADDLRLGQPVALKFLPESLYDDDARLGRFFEEVRLARQVTHPNVCRVHDVEEHEGEHFLSMEYVDGEDLATLLRRIGRLPEDKAIQIARQICAGLAAAHGRGILHRDLKPANVMIDGRGHVRLTDFGLAALAANLGKGDARAGTPAYMAPEQLDGTEVTPRSDVYSLGLVLYELFTGRPAFAADTLAEMRRLQKESTPATPTSIVEVLDPAVERAILRCLEPEPRNRPAGPLAVAASLPGGDPLAAALAAGEVPTPEMVAAAGEEGTLHPGLGLVCFLLVLAGLLLTVSLSGKRSFTRLVPLPKPPEALTVEARTLIERFRYTDPPADSVWGFSYDEQWLKDVMQTRPAGPTRWDDIGTVRPAPIRYWYRQSPRHLVPAKHLGPVGPADPPPRVSGQIDVTFDPAGRLLEFLAVPPQEEAREAQPGEPDWSVALEAAGLGAASLTPAPAIRNPLINCDTQSAWEGAYPGQPGHRLRVEGCSHGGRIAWFAVLPPWSRPTLMGAATQTQIVRVMIPVILAICTLLLGAAIVMVRKNLRSGRSDRRGALRFALYVFALEFAASLFGVDHVLSLVPEAGLITRSLQGALFDAAITWLIYIALEPHVRRLWPDALISWSRLLSGRLRDPRVGRDILLGAVGGVIMSCGILWLNGAGAQIGGLAHPPNPDALEGLLQGRKQIGWLLNVASSTVVVPISIMFMMLLLRVVLKRVWAAVLVMTLLMSVIGILPTLAQLSDSVAGSNPRVPLQLAIEMAGSCLLWGLVFFVMIRLGLLALLSLWFFTSTYAAVPLTLDPASWLFGPSALWLLLLSAIAFWAQWNARAGRPLLREGLLTT